MYFFIIFFPIIWSFCIKKSFEWLQEQADKQHIHLQAGSWLLSTKPMNACRDQGRKAGTIDCEDAQKTLCSQLADTSMTTVKQTHTTKQKNKITFELFLFCFIWNYFYQDSLSSFRLYFPLLNVTRAIIAGPNLSKNKHMTQIYLHSQTPCSP